jgi:anti-sigma regulatory factor (Ser/Thr protein kinase)
LTRPDAESVRRRIVALLPEHPTDIVRVVAGEFGISRQAAHAHVARLVKVGLVETKGQTRKRSYALRTVSHIERFSLDPHQDEDRIWRQNVEGHLSDLPEEILKICYHGFAEMFNNVIDHSESPTASLLVERTGNQVTLRVLDDGVGIFEKIRSRFNLEDDRQAILELSKGKLTTDPSRHSGEGIYFTSRMFDRFTISSGKLFFIHNTDSGDWLIEDQQGGRRGTTVSMTISADSRRKIVDVYEQYVSETDGEEFAFSRTHVPLRLAIYGTENLISRSQAKRVLRRFERFREVMLDFTGIDEIGQAFADEIFRVYKIANPQISVIAVNTTAQIRQMINRATAALNETSAGGQ